MNQPLVSVIVPTYNHGVYLPAAIESVLAQTYERWELIIVDNYSEDNTEEIVAVYQDPRIRYFKLQPNGTIAAPRNFGINNSSGEIIAFLDADDLWDSEKLTTQVPALLHHRRNGICFGIFDVIDSAGRKTGKQLGPKRPQLPESVYDRLIRANFIVTSSTLLTRKALNEAGLFDEDPRLRCTEDFDLWLRVVRKFRPVFVNQVLGSYRVHSDNNSDHQEKINRVLAVIDKHRDQGWIDEYTADAAKASFYFQVGWTIIDRNPILARRYLLSAIGHHYTNPRIIGVSTVAYLLSLTPAVYSFLRNKSIDSKISRVTVNSQNL